MNFYKFSAHSCALTLQLTSFFTKAMAYSVVCCVLLFSTLLLSYSAFAEDKAIQLKIEVSYIELHSGPGVGYPVLNVVEKGEFVEVLVKRTRWIKVKDKHGNLGWLHQDDLLALSHQGEQLMQSELTIYDFQNRSYETGVMYGNFDYRH